MVIAVQVVKWAVRRVIMGRICVRQEKQAITTCKVTKVRAVTIWVVVRQVARKERTARECVRIISARRRNR